MTTNVRERPQQSVQQSTSSRELIEYARMPVWRDLIETRGIDPGQWRVLTDSIFPAAKTTDAILLALDYCRARGLDPFKRPVNIVPMWNSTLGQEVETVWPGVNSICTDAARTGAWGGMDAPVWGPDVPREFAAQVKKRGKKGDDGNRRDGGYEDVIKNVTYPAWCSVTVYRIVQGQRCPFTIPVYWEEAYATMNRWVDVPNDMWARRPRGQLHKCAMAAALRAAFPESADYSAEEMEGKTIESGGVVIPGEAEEVRNSAPERDSRGPQQGQERRREDAPQQAQESTQQGQQEQQEKATSSAPPKPWSNMAWPVCDRSRKDKDSGEWVPGKCVDYRTPEAWATELQNRVANIQRLTTLDADMKRTKIKEVRDAQEGAWAYLREKGQAGEVKGAETFFGKAAGEIPADA